MKRLVCGILSLLIILSLTGCGSSGIKGRDDVSGKRIGVLAGTSSVRYGEMHGEVTEYNSKSTLVAALKSGEIDCIVADSHDSGGITRFKISLKTLKEPLAESNFRIAAAKENPDLISDINTALSYLEEEGILEDIIDGNYDGGYEYSGPMPPENAGTLTVALGGDFYPYKMTADGVYTGIDIDVAKAVCAYLGFNAEFTVVPSNDLIASVTDGRCHFAIGGITANTADENVCIMSNPYATCTQKIIVMR